MSTTEELVDALIEDAKAWRVPNGLMEADIATKRAALLHHIGEIERDARRLDYIEQLPDSTESSSLIFNWRFNGKRYGGGLRDAIDAALAQPSHTGETT